MTTAVNTFTDISIAELHADCQRPSPMPSKIADTKIRLCSDFFPIESPLNLTPLKIN